jgi:hypothetical protein
MAKRRVQLQQDANKASRLEDLRRCNGYKDLLEIIHYHYDSSMNDLLNKENPEARGAINVITNIMNAVNRDIDFGNVAREKYKNEYLSQTPNEGE